MGICDSNPHHNTDILLACHCFYDSSCHTSLSVPIDISFIKMANMSLSNPNSSWEVILPALYEKLTPIQRRAARSQYMRLQHYMCLFCKSSLYQQPPKEILEKPINWSLFPEGFLKYPLHLQHNHETGYTEGVVHPLCNAVLWQYHGR